MDENPIYTPVSPAVETIKKAPHPKFNMETMAAASTSFTPTPIPEMCTPPTPSRKRRSAAPDEEAQTERIIQAIASMEGRLKRDINAIKTDVDDIRRRLDEMAATMETQGAESRTLTEVIQQDITQGVNHLGGLMGKLRSKVAHARTILDGLLTNDAN